MLFNDVAEAGRPAFLLLHKPGCFAHCISGIRQAICNPEHKISQIFVTLNSVFVELIDNYSNLLHSDSVEFIIYLFPLIAIITSGSFFDRLSGTGDHSSGLLQVAS